MKRKKTILKNKILRTTVAVMLLGNLLMTIVLMAVAHNHNKAIDDTYNITLKNSYIIIWLYESMLRINPEKEYHDTTYIIQDNDNYILDHTF